MFLIECDDMKSFANFQYFFQVSGEPMSSFDTYYKPRRIDIGSVQAYQRTFEKSCTFYVSTKPHVLVKNIQFDLWQVYYKSIVTY